MLSIEEYIRAAAIKRGIDPDVAVRVARSEGGLKDPIRQSNVMKNGVREPSYGPFQLLVGGNGTGFPAGLGNAFMEQTGLDPRRPENAYAGIDFALDTAAKKGWGQWYGAKAAGLDNFSGIGGRAAPVGVSKPSSPESGPVFGAPPTPTPKPLTAQAIPPAVQQVADRSATQSPPNDIFGMLAMMQPQQAPTPPPQIVGPTPQQANGLLQLVQALKNRA